MGTVGSALQLVNRCNVVFTSFDALLEHDMMPVLAENSGCEISGTFECAKLHHFDIGNGQSHALCRVSNREMKEKAAC
jgi:hypothetical protein